MTNADLIWKLIQELLSNHSEKNESEERKD